MALTSSIHLIKLSNALPYMTASASGISINAPPDVDPYGQVFLPGFLKITGAYNDGSGTAARLGGLYASTFSIWNNFRDSSSLTSLGSAVNQKIQFCSDNNGILHFFAYATSVANNVIKHFTYFAGTWQLIASYTIPSTNFTFKIKIGVSNVINILVADFSTSSPNTVIRYAQISAAGVIGSFTTIGTTFSGVRDIDLYIDSSNVAHMLTGGSDGGFGSTTLFYAKSSNSWVTELVLTSPVSGAQYIPRMVIDSFGYVHVFATEIKSVGNSGTDYAYRNLAGVWTVTVLHAFTQNRIFRFPSITKDDADNIYMCFTDTTSTPTTLYFNQRLPNLGGFVGDVAITTNGSSSQSICNVDFLNPNTYPVISNNTGPGIAATGFMGICQYASGASTTDGYYYFQSSNFVRKTYAPLPPTPTPPTLPCSYQTGGEVRKLVSSVTGIDHLNSQIVYAVTDGQYVDQYTVSGGVINLNRPAATVHAGLPYTGKVQLLPLGGDGQTVNETKERKVYDIVLRLFKSLGGKFGRDSDNLFPFDIPDQDEDTVLFTGDLHDTPFESSFENVWQPLLVQDDPLPLMLLAEVIRSEISEDK